MSERNRITLPEGMKDRLKAKAAELAVPHEKLIEQALEMVLGGQVKPLVTNRTVSVEDAGEILLAHVEPAQAALILDLCRENHRKVFEYILSYVYLAHERGETATMVGESVLAAHTPAGADPLAGNTHCDHCRAPLVAPRRGQRFCPGPDPDDGTESCGRKHFLAEWRAHRAARTKHADNRHAPTPVNVEVFRRAAQSVA